MFVTRHACIVGLIVLLSQSRHGANLESKEIAVAVFAYDRPQHLERCLQSLEANLHSIQIKTFIFIDGPKNGDVSQRHSDVLKIANDFKKRHSDCEVEASSVNLGLRTSIVSAISNLFEVYKGLVIVEDDLVLRCDFLTFMTTCLKTYETDKNIFSISGYAEARFPPFIPADLIAAKRQSCWGWATWQDRWQSISWYPPVENDPNIQLDREKLASIGWDLKTIYDKYLMGLISSWAITFDAYAARNELRSLQPRYTLVDNFGMDGSGTHYINNIITKRVSKIAEDSNCMIISNYKISKSYDFWLRIKHSWLHNQIDRFRSFILIRISRVKSLYIKRH
jgi:hypothetical protein